MMPPRPSKTRERKCDENLGLIKVGWDISLPHACAEIYFCNNIGRFMNHNQVSQKTSGQWSRGSKYPERDVPLHYPVVADDIFLR